MPRAGCANFSQIATSTGTNVSDTGLAGVASYSYRVLAADGAGNLSGDPNTATIVSPSVTLTIFIASPTGMHYWWRSTCKLLLPPPRKPG